MPHKVDVEIGRKDIYGCYARGLLFDFEVSDQTTLTGLFAQAETNARKICEGRHEEFKDLTINNVH